ncbi:MULTISPECIES: MarR family winged helix-turn-helix transcriptional regulator [unclassified Streptomyces]|uniref:MarR family winged helix-turn-helix transcriptional regulator n=1 Tax=unclassified Streptomyces TaxID=2593676 RepID=UPI00255712CA|nr:MULTISPECIES: MarR family transcriptional regulator [unclassified Streptomyces]WRZ67997.1 MarR family transcriptional regulator [Streptomyces sp. NBC_01257]
MQSHPDGVRDDWVRHNAGLDASAMEVVALVKQVSALFERAVEPLYEGAPLTAPEADLLIPLRYATEPAIARRLADNMGMSRAGVSKTLAKLEKRGHIERTPNPADRRAALVTITDSGKRAIDQIFPRQVTTEAELLSGLGEDRTKVVEALALLARVMEDGLAHRHGRGLGLGLSNIRGT